MDFQGEKTRRRIDVIVDITPLIDVVFLLLIFFMITTTFVTSPGIEVELPKASNSDGRIEASDIIIAITSEGDLIYRRKQVNLEELTALLETQYSENPNATVIVQADHKVFHGLVVQLMDKAKAVGFKKLAIATREE